MTSVVVRRRRPRRKRKTVARNQVIRRVVEKVLKPQTELKFVDFLASTTVAAANSVTAQILNAISTGVDVSTRVGQRVRAKSLEYTIRLYSNQSPGGDTLVRWIIFRDKQANSSAPIPSNLLNNATSNCIDSHYYVGYEKRFVILKDVRMALNYYGETAKFLHQKIRLDFTEEFIKQDAGDYTDIATNSMWFWIFGDVSSNETSVSYNFRYYYTDE